MPTTPTLLPAAAAWLLINPWSTHTTPSQMCLYHLSLEYAHHAHPLPAVATWLSHLSLEHAYHARFFTSCGYVAMPPNPGVRPTHLAICQVWLCGYLPYPLSTPATPTLCQRGYAAISSIPEVHPSYCQLRLYDFSPGPRIRPPRPASRRCGGYVVILPFTSWDLAASFPSTGVRPSHTALPPAVVAVPPSPALS